MWLHLINLYCRSLFQAVSIKEICVCVDGMCDSVLKYELGLLEMCRAEQQCGEGVRERASERASEFLSHFPLPALPACLPGWSPSLSTLASCCLAANNRRCLQSNLPLPRPMRTGALFHQTTLFSIRGGATSPNVTATGSEVDRGNLLATFRRFKTSYEHQLYEWRPRDLYEFGRIMLGWDWKTLAQGKTREYSFNFIPTDARVPCLGLLLLLLLSPLPNAPRSSLTFFGASSFSRLDYGLGSQRPGGRWCFWRFTPKLHALAAACELRSPPETQLLPRRFCVKTDF